jgi:hypothetical protein
MSYSASVFAFWPHSVQFRVTAFPDLLRTICWGARWHSETERVWMINSLMAISADPKRTNLFTLQLDCR